MALSWKAVREGSIYCSPACGHGCTIKEYERAREAARKLAIRLNIRHSTGWRGRVWENMGWHFEATKGCCAVKRNGPGNYRVYFNASPQMLGDGTTPEAAVRHALRRWATFARHVAKVSAEWGLA